MKVAIIGRGSSAFRAWVASDVRPHGLDLTPGERCGVIIAINCAINSWPADWLVADDPSTFRYVMSYPKKGAAYRSDLAQAGEEMPHALPKWREMPIKWIDRAGKMAYPHTFSVESAICLAAELGGTEAHFFGCLPLGDGEPRPEKSAIASPKRPICDNPDRWKQEQKCMRRALTAYNIKGISHE